MNADHIHFIITFSNRELYKRWIRSLTGVLVRKIPGLRWEEVPYSRVATWGRDFKNLREYVRDNRLEAEFILTSHAEVDKVRSELEKQLSSMNLVFQI